MLAILRVVVSVEVETFAVNLVIEAKEEPVRRTRQLVIFFSKRQSSTAILSSFRYAL